MNKKAESRNKIEAELYIVTSYSNLYITLKKEGKIICSLTGGGSQESLKNNKRFKVSPETLSNMANKIKNKIRENAIKDLKVISKVSLSYIIKMFISALISYNININEIEMIIPIAHNGVRGRKLKRK